MLRLIDSALSWKYTPLVLLAVGGVGVVVSSLLVGALSGFWWLALPFALIEAVMFVAALVWGVRFVRSY